MDWISVYLLLVEFGINDPMFSLSNIRRLPMQLVSNLSQQATKGLKERRNAESMAVARLGVIMHSIGATMVESDDSVKVTERDFLPYPDIIPKITQQLLHPETIEIIRWLIKNNSVGGKILPLVSKYL